MRSKAQRWIGTGPAHDGSERQSARGGIVRRSTAASRWTSMSRETIAGCTIALMVAKRRQSRVSRASEASFERRTFHALSPRRQERRHGGVRGEADGESRIGSVPERRQRERCDQIRGRSGR